MILFFSSSAYALVRSGFVPRCGAGGFTAWPPCLPHTAALPVRPGCYHDPPSATMKWLQTSTLFRVLSYLVIMIYCFIQLPCSHVLSRALTPVPSVPYITPTSSACWCISLDELSRAFTPVASVPPHNLNTACLLVEVCASQWDHHFPIMSECANCKKHFAFGSSIEPCIICRGLFHAHTSCANFTASETRVLEVKKTPMMVYRCQACTTQSGLYPDVRQMVSELKDDIQKLNSAGGFLVL